MALSISNLLLGILGHDSLAAFSHTDLQDIRNKYGLENQPCDDFAVHFLGCCTPCAICQEAREIDYQSSDFSSMPPPPPEK